MQNVYYLSNKSIMMKSNLKSSFYIAVIALIFTACNKQNEAEALTIQKPKRQSDEYYANLRAYKKTEHQIFFGWFAAYANKEGVVADYKKSPSWGEHIAGIPDSMDICSLWMGVPSLKQNDSLTTYNPIAYHEMRHSMEVRGIKMVMPVIVELEGKGYPINDEGLKAYTNHLIDMVYDNDLDGLDIDWEPRGGTYLNIASNFAKMVQYASERLGPMSGTGKLLIVDYYNHTLPTTIEPFIDYLVNQAYTQGTTSNSGTNLQTRYDRVSSWCPPRKFIVTENMGEWWQNGGSPFTEVGGNTISPVDGTRMHSLEGMARWNPIQGKKAGWGGFYFDRDYNNYPPYKFVRRSIQIVNPAIK
jgi:hypothetical protein